jgi:DNA-binding PadR family transcriptional regulator
MLRTKELRKTILINIGERTFYGYELHRQLLSENVEVGISRLYRTLNVMLNEGLLEGRWEKSPLGPKKRMYGLGEKGKREREKILFDAIQTVHSFYGEYLLNLPPKLNVFNRVSRLLAAGLKGKVSIAYVIDDYSVVHEKVLYGLQKQTPEGRIYLVKPNSLEVDLKLDNLLSLEGDCTSIPLKDNFLDLVDVISVPRKDLLEASLKECHRVLKQSGTLAIVTPTIFVHKYDEPLAIGNFMEKYEHRMQGNEYINEETILALLKKFFNKVQKRSLIHLTIFLASKPVSS